MGDSEADERRYGPVDSMETEQGSKAWHALRCGKITGSRIADVMAKGRSGAPSASRANYMAELVVERLTGIQPEGGFVSREMQWGKDHEAEAVLAYEFYHNVETAKVAFVDHPTIPMCGASPDRLVGADGLLEFKCPNTATHLATLLGGQIDGGYIKQMMWQMACTGRRWCDFASYDPRLPDHLRLHVRRVHRDAAMIVEIETAVRHFAAELDEALADLARRFPAPDAAAA